MFHFLSPPVKKMDRYLDDYENITYPNWLTACRLWPHSLVQRNQHRIQHGQRGGGGAKKHEI